MNGPHRILEGIGGGLTLPTQEWSNFIVLAED